MTSSLVGTSILDILLFLFLSYGYLNSLTLRSIYKNPFLDSGPISKSEFPEERQYRKLDAIAKLLPAFPLLTEGNILGLTYFSVAFGQTQ